MSFREKEVTVGAKGDRTNSQAIKQVHHRKINQHGSHTSKQHTTIARKQPQG